MKITLIVPVYNVEKYVKQCIESLCNQTIKDIEIIVIDDGSTDNSINKVKEIKDNRIKIISKENGGLSSARNVGIKHANGKYIAFIDSDDFIGIDTAYEDMYNIALREKSDIVAGNAIWYWSNEENYIQDRDMRLFNHSPMVAEEFFLASLKSNRIYAPVWLNFYKKDFIIKNDLYFREGIYHEDEEFIPRVLLKANKISIYNRDFYIYRQRRGSITNEFNKKRYSDLLSICLSVEKEIINISNPELQMLLGNKIAEMAILSVYKYRDSYISNEVKQLIKRNAAKKGTIIRKNIMSINTKLYFNLEDLYRKIRKWS